MFFQFSFFKLPGGRKRKPGGGDKWVIPRLTARMTDMMPVDAVLERINSIMIQLSSPRDPNLYKTGFCVRAQVIISHDVRPKSIYTFSLNIGFGFASYTCKYFNFKLGIGTDTLRHFFQKNIRSADGIIIGQYFGNMPFVKKKRRR